MDGKEAPPSYDEVIGSSGTAPPPPTYNTGYPPTQGNQGATQWAYPTTTGYPQGYGNTVYGNQAGYVPAQPGFPAGYGPVGQGAGHQGFSHGVQQPTGYLPQQQGYHPGQHTVVVNQTIDRETGAVNTVPDGMVLAVFATLCCCWPFGLVAIMKAQKCRQALQTGNVAAARTASDESRRYSKFAIIAGICWINFCVIMMIIYMSMVT